MKITVSQWDLADALQKLQSVVPVRSQKPIFQNVYLEATDNGLYCTAMNNINGIATRILLQGLVEAPGGLTVNCRKLASLVKLLEQEQVSLEAVTSDRIQILSGKGKYKLSGLPADEFPKIPSGSNLAFTIPSGNLRAALVDTDFAASTDDVRQMLNGVCLTFKDNKIEFAACDGHQVAVSVYETKSDESLGEIIIPLRASREIVKVFTDDEDISVFLEESNIIFSTGSYQIVSRKIDQDAPYPNYWRFIGFDHKDVMLVNREQLQKSLQRIALFAKGDAAGVDLIVNEAENILEVKSELERSDDNEMYDGDGIETIEITERTAALDFRISSKILSDILKRLSCKDVMISMAPENNRVALKSPDNDNQVYTLALVRRSVE